MIKDYENLGIAVPQILIPEEKVNLKKWAVIACDQFTVDRGYWAEVEKIVGNSPSTLRMTLPEVYLDDPDKQQRIDYTKEAMYTYLENGVLQQLPEGFVLVEREVDNTVRKGLMVLFDLENYDFDISNKPLLRPTEQILTERIPPRLEIRAGAPVELPHVFVFMDDSERSVIEPLFAARQSLKKLYDFELMQGGGRIAGYFVDDPSLTRQVLDAVDRLSIRDGMRFCVADGNHSIATAKEIWERSKGSMSEEERATSPLRYVLAELVNIHDEGVALHPIHRVIMGVNPAMCIQYVVDKLNQRGIRSRLVFSRRKVSMKPEERGNHIYFISKDSVGRIEITSPCHPLAVGDIQPVLEDFAAENPQCKLDYIHGDQNLLDECANYDTLGFMMPGFKKNEFFDIVINCGILPKKSFSIGEAEQKRYYLEGRLIVKPVEDEEATKGEAPAIEEPAAEEAKYVSPKFDEEEFIPLRSNAKAEISSELTREFDDGSLFLGEDDMDAIEKDIDALFDDEK